MVLKSQARDLFLEPSPIGAVADNQINQAGNFVTKRRQDRQHLIDPLGLFLAYPVITHTHYM